MKYMLLQIVMVLGLGQLISERFVFQLQILMKVSKPLQVHFFQIVGQRLDQVVQHILKLVQVLQVQETSICIVLLLQVDQ